MINETQRLPIGSMLLRVYDGETFKTDCTCRERMPARVWFEDGWRAVCRGCGSLRENTGT